MPDITSQLIQQARAQSEGGTSCFIEVLQRLSGLADTEFVEQLAALFHCPAMF